MGLLKKDFCIGYAWTKPAAVYIVAQIDDVFKRHQLASPVDNALGN